MGVPSASAPSPHCTHSAGRAESGRWQGPVRVEAGRQRGGTFQTFAYSQKPPLIGGFPTCTLSDGGGLPHLALSRQKAYIAHIPRSETMRDLSVLGNLDLSCVAKRLQAKHGWPRYRAERAVEDYKAYLARAGRTATNNTAPSRDVDEAWHLHILDTVKYHNDCILLFGEYLHHVPRNGRRFGALCDRCDSKIGSTRRGSPKLVAAL